MIYEIIEMLIKHGFSFMVILLAFLCMIIFVIFIRLAFGL